VARATSERDAAKASGKAEESESRAGSSVERSLEEFISRANAVSPPSAPSGKRRRKESELGPDDRTEIVSRPLPYSPPESRRYIWTMFAVAFAAGAAAVVLALRLLAPPPPVVAPAPAIPPIVVIPQPTVEMLPEPMTDFPVTVKPAEAAKPEPAPPPKKKKKPSDTGGKEGKTPTGLVDRVAE
jgi:hypothetical protein